jgi:hypothetical protein
MFHPSGSLKKDHDLNQAGKNQADDNGLKKKRLSRNNMNQVLEDIHCIPGVSAACFFHHQKGIISQKTSANFNGEKFASAARILSKMYSGSNGYYNDIERISLFFNELNLIVAGITEKIFVVICHSDEIDKNLLDMTVSQSVKALKDHVSSHIRAKNAENHETAPAVPVKQDTRHDTDHSTAIEKIIRTEIVSQSLYSMEKMLNRIMGPISAIIFNDTLQTWIKRSSDEKIFSIDILADILFNEIDDPEKIETYRNMIEPHLKPVREKYHTHMN